MTAAYNPADHFDDDVDLCGGCGTELPPDGDCGSCATEVEGLSLTRIYGRI